MIRYYLLILFGLFVSTSGHANVELKGLTQIDQDHILSRYPELKNPVINLSMLDQIIRQLTLLEIYSSISVDEVAENKYILLAVPLKKVGELKIIGNKEIDKDTIATTLGLKPGIKFDNGKLIEAGEKLKEYYARQGFLNTIVSFNFEEMSKSDLRILVQIRERTPCQIESISFEMVDKNDDLNTKLLKRAKKYLDKNFTEERLVTIENTFAEYLSEKRFLNSKVQQKEAHYNSEKTKVSLVYEVNDPYAFEILFNGNRKFSSGKLLKSLKLEEFSLGLADPAEDIAQKIKSYYIINGYAHVKISYTDKTITKNFTKQIYINVEEGPLVKIDRLDVVGRISKKSLEYSDFILENSSDTVEDGYFVRTDLENGYKNLATHLNNQGFLKAKVQSARVEYNDKKNLAHITVILDEGPLTRLAKIQFEGVKSFSEAHILKEISLEKNAPLKLNALENSIENLKKFYYERGFIEMKITNENDSLVEYDEKGLQATLQFKIFEGPQVFVKSVHSEGNSFTKDYVILREAGIEPGDLVTPEYINEATKRLDKLAIFSRIDIHTLEANTPTAQRTVVIKVSERNPGLFKFGAGVTNKRDLTARGFGGVFYNNIGGTARAVSIRGTLENNLAHENYLEYEASLGYLEPFLFDQRIRGRAGYTKSKKISDASDEKVLVTDSLKLTAEKDLTSKIKFSWLVWGFDSVEQFDLPDSGPLVRESRQEIAYIGPTVDIDYRDNPFLPTLGNYTKLDAEYSSPFLGSSDKIEFMRTQALYSHYFRLGSPKVIWANSFRTGYEKNLSQKLGSGIPTSFAFFLGGFTTVRGYAGDKGDRIPNDSEFPNDNEVTQLIITDESKYYLIKSELRYPLWSEIFGGVLFYDAGQVDVQGQEFKNPLRQSYGVGIRVNTPVGPISLDYARKFRTTYDGESPDQWHLSIGTF